MSRSAAIKDLRRAVDGLPLATRIAMLQGVREETIIVGAYTDGSGGVCPMLAAHRRGGRTTFLQFARTWDSFTRAPSRGSRPAKQRELDILARHLEASIQAEDEVVSPSEMRAAIAEHRSLVARRAEAEVASAAEMAAAIADHQALLARRAAEQARSAETERPRRRERRMPAWMRPMGSIEEYERALEEVDRQKVRLGLVGDTAGPANGVRATGREPERSGTFIAS